MNSFVDIRALPLEATSSNGKADFMHPSCIMATEPYRPLDGAGGVFVLRRSKNGGFSLVEIVIAIGIVSFVFLTILGLIPTGLSTFSSAIDTSVSGQIFQRVSNEAQQTDFDTLVDRAGMPENPPANYTFRAPTVNSPGIRYFDEQGNECSEEEAIYHVNTRISPSTAIGSFSNASIATITVQIAKNPGNGSLPIDAASNLWTTNSSFEIQTRSTFVARSD